MQGWCWRRVNHLGAIYIMKWAAHLLSTPARERWYHFNLLIKTQGTLDWHLPYRLNITVTSTLYTEISLLGYWLINFTACRYFEHIRQLWRISGPVLSRVSHILGQRWVVGGLRFKGFSRRVKGRDMSFEERRVGSREEQSDANANANANAWLLSIANVWMWRDKETSRREAQVDRSGGEQRDRDGWEDEKNFNLNTTGLCISFTCTIITQYVWHTGFLVFFPSNSILTVYYLVVKGLLTTSIKQR